MKPIPLAGGKGVALVDDADYATVNQLKWFLGSSGYAEARTRTIKGLGRRKVLMHRYLLGLQAGDGVYTDHINGNRLDNQRANLRPCSQSQNMANCRWRNHRLGYKGVHRIDRKRKGVAYDASIRVRGRQIHLGRFETPEQAARAYDAAAERHFGEFAKLNFPVAAKTSAVAIV